MADFVEEAPGLADDPVQALGNHCEERGDRHSWNLVSFVEEGGQEPVDEGEAGASAGVAAGCWNVLPVAAASLVEVCFPLDFACRAQCGDERAPPLVRDAGQGRVDQP